jgi:hypothetical protein
MRESKPINKYIWPIDFFKSKYLNNIKSKKYFYKTIEHERERANRNNHQVSLIIFNLKSFPKDGIETRRLIENIILKKRNIDEIGWFNKHSVGLILPYTSSHGAREFIVRLSSTLQFTISDSFCYLSTYPFEENSDFDNEKKYYNAAKNRTEGVENLAFTELE